MAEALDPSPLETQLRAAALAAARFGGMPPTVASTGGPGPAFYPGASVPMSAAPSGSVPSMGLGESPPPQPLSQGFDESGFTAAFPPSAQQPAAGAPPLPTPTAPDWLAGARMPVGILNGATPPPPDADAGPRMPVSLAPPSPGAAAAPVAAQPPPVPDTSLMGRLAEVAKRVSQSINDHPSTMLALAGGFAGAPSLGMGMSRAFTGAVPAMQMDIKQGQQNQTVRALIARGVPADVAQAAATNPAILQQMLPQLFGPKQRKFTEISTDMLGNKRFGFVDEVNNKVYDLAGTEIKDHGGGTAIPNGPDGMPLRGPELLAHLEKNEPLAAAGVKGLISGDLSAASRNLQKLGPLAELVDPTFSMAEFPKRLALQKNYLAGGKQFQELQAIGTVAGHLDDLSKAADKLDNTSFPILNQARNIWRTNTGDPRVDQFNTVKQAVTNELSKAYRGGHVTEGDVREWQTNISAAKSPEQLRGVIGQMNDLLMSKRNALEEGYRSGMGKTPLPAEFSSVSDHAREVFNRVSDWAHGAKPAPAVAGAAAAAQVAEGMTATNPQNGQKIIFRNGRWMLLQ